jgi:light-harvesting complex 1 beta chain
MSQITNESVQGSQRNDSLTFYGIFAISFVVFLAIALIAQVLCLQWRSWFPGAEGGKTLIGDVRAAVYTFMSQLT